MKVSSICCYLIFLVSRVTLSDISILLSLLRNLSSCNWWSLLCMWVICFLRSIRAGFLSDVASLESVIEWYSLLLDSITWSWLFLVKIFNNFDLLLVSTYSVTLTLLFGILHWESGFLVINLLLTIFLFGILLTSEITPQYRKSLGLIFISRDQDLE